MIEVRIKGVALNKTLRTDAEGFACFSLDETKHDAFDVLARCMSQCGAPADSDRSKLAYQRVMAERARIERERRAA